MSDRIRQLEDALTTAQFTLVGSSGEAHPLLHRDLLKIKSSLELHSANGQDGIPLPSSSGTGESSLQAPQLDDLEEDDDDEDEEKYIDSFGTLAIRDDGAATFYGRSAGQESLLIVRFPDCNHVCSYKSILQGEVTASSSPVSETAPSRYYNSPSLPSNYPNGIVTATDHSFTHADYYNAAAEVPLPNNIANAAQGFPLGPTLPSESPPIPNPHTPVTLSLLLRHYLPPLR